MWYKLAILVVIILSSCGRGSEIKGNQANENPGYSESEYLTRDSTISISNFIARERTLGNAGNVFERIPERLSDQNAFSDFEINTNCDTVFMKYEHLTYKWYTYDPLINGKRNGYSSKDFYQLLVWNKHKMAYFDDNKKDLLELSETTSEELKESNDRFFKLVEDWDTVKLNERKCEIFPRMWYPAEPSVVTRVIFNRGSYSIDKYAFKDLSFPKDRIDFYFLTRGDAKKIQRSYNALIEDILFYRHSRGLLPSDEMSQEDKAKARERFRQMRKEQERNPEYEDIFDKNHQGEVITLDSSKFDGVEK